MSYKILIADDDKDIRNLLRLYLENEEYEVVEAGDGEVAINLLKNDKIGQSATKPWWGEGSTTIDGSL